MLRWTRNRAFNAPNLATNTVYMLQYQRVIFCSPTEGSWAQPNENVDDILLANPRVIRVISGGRARVTTR